MKKKIAILVAITSITATLTGCNIQDYSFDKNNNNSTSNKEVIDVKDVNIKYDNGLIPIYNADSINIIEKYKLPALERMSKEDEKTLLGNSQVLKRIEALNISKDSFYTPEKNWKTLYNEVKQEMYKKVDEYKEVIFEGNKGSDLNKFISQNPNTKILLKVNEVNIDETINIPSNVFIEGTGTTRFICESGLDKAVIFDKSENSGISGVQIDSNANYGIYVVDSKNILIKENKVLRLNNKAIVVMGDNSGVIINGNYISENKHGSIFLNGNVTKGIIENNILINNDGKENLTAGIVLASMIIKDKYTAYNEHQDIHLYDLKEAPNNLVIKDNVIEDGHSSGIYSDAGYMNYIIENEIRNNDKEGICLDYGTFGTYVSQNRISSNGGRSRQSDEDLKRDFIADFGRLKDGSSPAKLPGISIDNAAYNIIKDNNINLNYGSGVKMVRSGYRNIIMSNNISDNNAGESEKFHFFGIELGHASDPDEPVKGLDFTADYENIVCRNMISGTHYSGIFLAEEDYINDIFDNTIMDVEMFSIESLTNKHNNSVNNMANRESRGISLSQSSSIIIVPNMVN